MGESFFLSFSDQQIVAIDLKEKLMKRKTEIVQII